MGNGNHDICHIILLLLIHMMLSVLLSAWQREGGGKVGEKQTAPTLFRRPFVGFVGTMPLVAPIGVGISL